jgi:hypothetical protein
MRKRNPIAKAVRLIRPQTVPDKRRKQLEVVKLRECEDESRQNSNRELKS